MWGHHYRSGDILESGKVTSLEEADTVEILVDQGSLPPATQVEVDYTIGSEHFQIQIRKGSTIEDLQQRLQFIHKNRPITGIASQGIQIASEDDVEEWLSRSKNHPFQILTVKSVQVIVDFRDAETHFVTPESASEEDFLKAVRPHLGLAPKSHITVTPLGLDSWQIRAGFTYTNLPLNLLLRLRHLLRQFLKWAYLYE
jgi:hypothetical protein